MKEKTDLNSIRATALALLMTDYHTTEMSPLIIQHPFTNTGFVQVCKDGEPLLIDVTKNKDNLLCWQKQMREQIMKAKDPYALYMMCNMPYGLTFLKFAMPHLSRKDFSEILSDAWIRSENPNNDPNISTKELVSMFKAADIEYLMEASEREELAALDDEVTIYRGVTSYNENHIKAMSWTLDYDTADWFAHRFHEEGTVYEAKINKRHILALFNGRNESEVISYPDHQMDITEAEVPEADITMKQ